MLRKNKEVAKMKRIFLVVFALMMTISANAYSHESIDGITWQYDIVSGEAELYCYSWSDYQYNWHYNPCVSTSTTGELKIPEKIKEYLF
jgi:hypothetical protein